MVFNNWTSCLLLYKLFHALLSCQRNSYYLFNPRVTASHPSIPSNILLSSFDLLSLISLRLVPVLVNGMKYSEIDIILLKVSYFTSQDLLYQPGHRCEDNIIPDFLHDFQVFILSDPRPLTQSLLSRTASCSITLTFCFLCRVTWRKTRLCRTTSRT